MSDPPVWQHRREAEVDVVGLGQGSLDHVAELDQLPEWSQKVPIASYARLPGGQIATAVLACTRLGLSGSFVARLGDDDAAVAILAPLVAAGVDIDGVRRAPGTPSQLALIIVDRRSGERTVLWHRDPRLRLDPERLRRDEIERGRLLLLDAGDLEASLWAAGVARSAGIPVVLDADTPAPRIEELLARVDFPIVSREFAVDVFGAADERALRAMSRLGASLPVITLGARGALGLWQDRLVESPAFAVEARDTTGAGDVFHGAFSAGLLEGFGVTDLLRFANAAAGCNCRELGAQGGLPDRAAVEGLIAAS